MTAAVVQNDTFYNMPNLCIAEKCNGNILHVFSVSIFVFCNMNLIALYTIKFYPHYYTVTASKSE